MSHRQSTTEAGLDKLQHESFNGFLYEANAANGLLIDKTAPDGPASIAATGLALAAYPVGVERRYMSRSAAVEGTLTTLCFFWTSPHGPEPDATGYNGFYYHVLDMQTGRRAWQCELATVDTTFLLAGALTAGLPTMAFSNTGGRATMRQCSFIWIDFRGIQDAVMREKGTETGRLGTAACADVRRG